jgi:CHAT domain-containing protein/predicted negative regulator of RcsB-dependent stress response
MPVNATILPAVMRLGVNMEQLNRKQLLELVNHLIVQIDALLRRMRIISLLIWVGLSASPYLWPGAAPVQASASECSAIQTAQESNSLEPGKPIQRELSGGQSHSYKITMISGQYLHVVVDQRGIDVAVALFTPDAKKINEADCEHLIEGSETVSAIADAAGAYLIEVRSPEKTARSGRYEIKIEELRAASAEDKYRVAGEAVFREAERLKDGTSDNKGKSVEKYYEALELYRRATDRNGEAVTLNNIGLVYRSLGEMQKALEKYNEALPLRRATGDRSGEAQTLSNIGAVYWSLGETQKALEKYNEALPIRRAVGDRRGEAVTLNNIGLVYRSLGETRKALEKHNEALQTLQAVGDRSLEATTLNSIGEVYQSMGEAEKALERYNEALLLRRAVGDRNGEAVTLLGIARVEQKRGNLTQARQTIEQAIGLIESLRANIASQELRASYFASRQEFFETYIDVLMQMHQQNQAAGFNAVALAVSERARARSLLELLKEAGADIRQGVDGSLLERERSLQQRLNAKAAEQVSLLNRKHNPEQASAAAKEIAAITAEYEEVQAQIRARSPRYAALTQPQPLGSTEIQQQALDEDTLLLEYALGEKRSYLWLVSQRSIDSYELPPRAEVEAAARRVYELGAARPKRGIPPDPQFIAQARALSGMLLGPVAPRLGGKRLVVVAPGALSYLPFAALPAPEDKKRQAGDYEPLIAKHEVVSIPSASVLSIIRRETAGRQRATKSIAVLADPVFEANDPRLAQAKNGNSSGDTPARTASDAELSELKRAIRTRNFSDARAGFTRLVFSRKEAESIIALTPKGTGLKATDFNASRDLAMSRQLSQYRVLHFATHGLFNSERPELSGLVFSLIDQKGKPQDGFLRLHEIYNLQLNADLIVLSAGETGLGKEIKGEGLIGLTRGFMYSGAPRVVSSLWKVDDLATAELMKLFYQRMLKDGLPAGAALRAAQLDLSRQKRWASPYFWAGFVLHGEWK